MPTNNAVEPDGSICPDTDEMRERLQGLLADLDFLGERLAAIHIQTALDCLGKAWPAKESITERSPNSAVV